MSRETLLPLLAAYALQHGFSDASLRPMAKAAGTSDRMLLYHFGSKQQLMDELLSHLADIYAAALDDAFPKGRTASLRACIDQVMAATRSDPFKPFMRLWWQSVAGGVSGEPDWAASSGRIMGTMLRWLEEHLPEGLDDLGGTAHHMLAVIEGASMLDAVGRSDIGDLAIAKAFPE
ncbi:TetR family transcriptional regulator [Altererythrobacter aestiaquae]|uniref:TetR family transcriptional regulator n=2 Tax=Pontixanthobacter aestiaquae TaxID=1509367 RepID=A0A844Z5S0_9SPHN|nr:TetR family transcriptional regulator [Pontixanthobacter aestiaquae]